MTVTLTAAGRAALRRARRSRSTRTARRAPAQDVLVLAPLLNAPVEPNAYVTVIGEVVKFDIADAAARMKDAMPAARAGRRREVSRPRRDHRHVGDQRRDDRPRQAPAAADVTRGAGAEQGDETGRPRLHRAPRSRRPPRNGPDTAAQAAALVKLFGEAAAFWKIAGAPRRDPVDRGREDRERRDRSRRRERGLGRGQDRRPQAAGRLRQLPRHLPRAARRRDVSVQEAALRPDRPGQSSREALTGRERAFDSASTLASACPILKVGASATSAL